MNDRPGDGILVGADALGDRRVMGPAMRRANRMALKSEHSSSPAVSGAHCMVTDEEGTHALTRDELRELKREVIKAIPEKEQRDATIRNAHLPPGDESLSQALSGYLGDMRHQYQNLSTDPNQACRQLQKMSKQPGPQPFQKIVGPKL